MIPIVLPPVSVSVAWRFSYQEQFGVYNYLLSLLHLGPVRWLSDRNIALYSVMATDVWQATPFVFLLLLAGLQAMPSDPFEAAAIDGATPWQVFRTITLPLLRPTLLVVVLLRTIDAARIFDKIFIMTNGGGPGHVHRNADDVHLQDGVHPVRLRLRGRRCRCCSRSCWSSWARSTCAGC